MPLIPRDGGPVHRIEITEAIDPYSVGDWYEIRTMLGYHARMQADTISAMKFSLPAGRLERGEIDPSEMVQVQMNLADASHLKLSLWLKAWSHKEDITSLTIRRIPKAHADAILKAIAAFERIQGGPRWDGPLADTSDNLSDVLILNDGGFDAGPIDLDAYGLDEDERERLGLSDPADDATQREAVRLWTEYWLNLHGVSYAAQGYHTGDGVTLWARKIDEHLICQLWVDEATEERDAEFQRLLRARS